MRFRTGFILLMSVGLFFCLPQVKGHAFGFGFSSMILANAGAQGGGGGDTVTPDLFSGTLSYNVPIEVPPGRNGMQPQMSLLYRSGNGNGLLGVGWELEPGAVVRSLKGGVNYSGDAYALRLAGATIDLVNIGTNASGNTEYRAKIEGSFNRIEKIIDNTGQIYWKMTDKVGIKYTYGTTGASRQDDASNTAHIFKWCLEKVEDPDGNYMIFSYIKDQGQIYLDRVDYTGNNSGLLPTNYVKFYWETRADAPVMYTTNFGVTTARRLKTIDVMANGARMRTYAVAYRYSPDTGRSLISGIQLYGKDATLDANGLVTGGTALPATTFDWQTGGGPFNTINGGWSNPSQGFYWDTADHRIITGDFNGDGKMDIFLQAFQVPWSPPYYCSSQPTYPGCTPPAHSDNSSGVFLGDGNGNFTLVQSWTGSYLGFYWDTTSHTIIAGDFNGDGRTDLFLQGSGTNPSGVFLSDSNGHFSTQDQSWSGTYLGLSWDTSNHNIIPGDFNGDGRTDLFLQATVAGNQNGVFLADSSGHFTTSDQSWSGTYLGFSWDASNHNIIPGDFNGDGRTDLFLQATVAGNQSGVFLAGSNGYFTTSDQSWSGTYLGLSWDTSNHNIIPGDFNGDGRMDLLLQATVAGNQSGVFLAGSNGHFTTSDQSWSGTYLGFTWDAGTHIIIPGDFNGDGKTDLILQGVNANYYSAAFQADNNGHFSASAVNQGWPDSYLGYSWNAGNHRIIPGEINGDGRTDLFLQAVNWDNANALLFSNSGYPQADLIKNISNGMGGNTAITYTPSTAYNNNGHLPFPVQTVSSVTTCDNYNASTSTCAGNSSTTTYTYSGGYFNMADKEFRGFNYAKVTGPAGPNGEKTITETWFHQGNDTAVDANTPSDSVGYMKGKPYRVRVSDGLSNKLSETTTAYASGTATPYYYNPPLQVDHLIYSGGVLSETIRAIYTFDSYGNLTREDNYGDLADPSDDRTTVKTYGYNPINWMMAFPTNVSVYQGIGTASQVSGADYFYDGAADCNTASTNQVPTKGKLTRVVRWNGAGTGPEARMAYDGYGNKICGRDGNGNISTLTYDSSFTFPTVATNPLGQQVTTQYYGVNGVAADTGLYGQTKSVTGPNGDVTALQYDVFGRKVRETLPDNSWTTTAYNSLGGGVGVQNTSTTNSAGLSSWIYFDGLGRTITEKSTGPDNKLIAKKTVYDARGAARQTSLPYFDGLETPRYATVTRDAQGRVIRTDLPDGTFMLSCYSGFTTATVDADGHKKRETKNAQGKLIQVDEYTGTYTGCDTTSGTLYSTTVYQYDTLGNLRFVTDGQGNQTEMRYDALGYKTWMHDPDMGNWSYTYDANGNLVSQVDAKGQTTFSQYDALNRLRQKDYLLQKTLGLGDVVYNYDELTSSNGKGRITSMVDATGRESYQYDVMGHATRTDKVVTPYTYTVFYGYDQAGRQTSVTYPDNSVITYTYNGPFLAQVTEGATVHAAYAGYNAMGQPGSVTYANGVTTSYTYSAVTNRLQAIATAKGGMTYQSLSYTYDNVGNITQLNDAINGNQSFTYDDLNRLTAVTAAYGNLSYTYDQVGNMTSNSQLGAYTYNPSGATSIRPHAVIAAGANAYAYDNNGNMISGAGRTFTYDVENRPTAITLNGVTSTFGYDGNGQRVIKAAGTATINYVGGLYECTLGVSCDKYIFANGKRVVKKTVTTGATYYYHADHLGSSSVMTDAAGNLAENVAYYPYGGSRSDTGAISVRHKFTGQELDAETGLYFYGARYYDSVLGRFISPDTIIPDPADPQAFNRYSYCRNNPLIYTDPSGHFEIFAMLLGGLFNGIVSALSGGDFWKGFATGAISAAAFGLAGDVGPTGGLGAIGNHIVAGAASGGINASITGGNVGMGMLTGGVAGGVGELVGSYMPKGDYTARFAGSTIAGGISGGVVTAMYGGDFWQGFGSGALTAAAGDLFNCAFHSGTCWPTVGGDDAKTQDFYWKNDLEHHYGTDYGTHALEYVLAVSDGEVVAAGPSGVNAYGNRIETTTTLRGITTYYAHTHSFVHEGDHVKAGQIIGYIDQSGNSHGAHLHFELRYNGFAFDSLPYLNYK